MVLLDDGFLVLQGSRRRRSTGLGRSTMKSARRSARRSSMRRRWRQRRPEIFIKAGADVARQRGARGVDAAAREAVPEGARALLGLPPKDDGASSPKKVEETKECASHFKPRAFWRKKRPRARRTACYGIAPGPSSSPSPSLSGRGSSSTRGARAARVVRGGPSLSGSRGTNGRSGAAVHSLQMRTARRRARGRPPCKWSATRRSCLQEQPCVRRRHVLDAGRSSRRSVRPPVPWLRGGAAAVAARGTTRASRAGGVADAGRERHR